MSKKFTLQEVETCSPQELLHELQLLVEEFQNMTPDEKAEFATNDDIGACYFMCWSILKVLTETAEEGHE
jgi:hypothetical protein